MPLTKLSLYIVVHHKQSSQNLVNYSDAYMSQPGLGTLTLTNPMKVSNISCEHIH